MAEEFQTGICSSGSWWSAARTGGFDGPMLSTAVSCSTDFTGVGGSFNWAVAADTVEAKSRSSDESPGSVSNSSITFQDTHKPPASDQLVADPLMDSTLQIPGFGLSSPSINWHQPLFTTGGGAEANLHALLQEDMNSRPNLRQEPVIESNKTHMNVESSSFNLLKDLNQGLKQDQHHFSSSVNGYPLFPASFGLPPTLLQGLFEPESKPQQSFSNQQMNPSMSYLQGGLNDQSLQSQVAKLPQLNMALPPKQQFHFTNNTPFWNPSATATNETTSSLYSSIPTHEIAPHAFKGKTNNPLVKSNSDGAGDSSSNAIKKSSAEPAFKKPRMETPSPLPTFKVRKEKLGDRVTALQQLVSPFGKTDTASVLHEAIEYIKFLHEQVGVLSAPYWKHGHQSQHLENLDKTKDGEGPKLDLRSRGLCLVPISSTFAVASETPVDFWTPTFGGNYR